MQRFFDFNPCIRVFEATRFGETGIYHVKKKLVNKFINTIAISFFLVTEVSCSKSNDLGKGFRLSNNGEYTLAIVDQNSTVLVGSCILDYAFDSTYILASQRPWDIIPDSLQLNYDERRNAFEKSAFRRYWIINKNAKSWYSLDTFTMRARYSNVYGPFNKEDYWKKCSELGVPKELQLKEDSQRILD